MKINEIIKEKRLELGYTQEQLANYLNVSAPAVNKWEKNVTYPDITILPALARTLNTDLNTLLSFKSDLSDYEIALFLNELATIKDFKQGYAHAMKKINEYPTCYSLILNTANTLMGMLQMAKVDNFNEYEQEIESLLNRVLLANDPAIKHLGQASLISIYLKRKNFAKAQEIIDELPEPQMVDKKQQLIKITMAQEKYDDAAKLIEEKLLNTVNEINTYLLQLMEIALKQDRNDDAAYIADVSTSAATIFDLWQYNRYVARFQLYATTKNKIEILKIIGPMLKSVMVKWDINASPLYRHIKAKKFDINEAKEVQEMMIASLKSDDELSFLKDELIKEN